MVWLSSKGLNAHPLHVLQVDPLQICLEVYIIVYYKCFPEVIHVSVHPLAIFSPFPLLQSALFAFIFIFIDHI